MTAASEAREARSVTQHLSFTVAGSTFGMPVLRVKEILQYDGETKVPGSPSSVRGVVNVRGEVVPLVDLGLKFGRAEVVPSPRTCVLVVEARLGDGALVFGLIADRVNEVVDLVEDQIAPPPEMGAGLEMSYLKGMGKTGREFLLLLDLDAALSDLEQSRIHELTQQSHAN